ncbi:ribosome maturation factor RimM [Microbulbifer sp. EKSA008]|uniref:ribosome maturation factor RimM n=1 Tax=unclassified Microbulbifer TaxID=2619833 RepID=UPI000D52D95B|nr:MULTISPECIES: ribosome maturation factor RimM [unclassified Microbulbifer]AWF83482.1 ribosome maturation factor RimM [Microbulbifer sp. A4B17]WHI48046.1 ribosome maturation factor RimM [Microbulbifer sp. VAAF005]WNZ55123.1 ribosome maturation factor RimM [Microbulbifer sp. MKSA007]
MTDNGKPSEELVTVGRVTTVYGVRGWVKVHSYTEPMDNILQFPNWRLQGPKGWEALEIDAGKRHGKGLIVHVKGIDDRDLAARLCQRDIAVARELMPELEHGEYYWHQLEGLKVVSHFDGEDHDFGTVARMMETGANDVMVVRGGADKRERLIPYLPDQFITNIDLEVGVITVDWDPAF